MAKAITYFNGGPEIEYWYYTGADNIQSNLVRALLNGVVIFERVLELVLPCNPADSTINLADFIAAADPIGEYRLINIILNPSGVNPAACHHPTIVTGDLNGLEVTFTNNGSIEQRCNADYALGINSPIKFINNGYLRGRGGDGGKGGTGHVGKTSSGTSTKWEGPFYQQGTYHWYSTCAPFPGSRDVRVTYKWNGGGGTAQSRATPCTSQVTSKSSGGSTYYRSGGAKTGNGSVCDGNDYDYYAIKRKTTTTFNYPGGAGGAGGAGGKGICYKQSASSGSNGSGGAPGGDPETTRGYTGGKGGKGGTWGEPGENGERGGGSGSSGSAGTTNGVAIRGNAILAAGSELNNGTWHVAGIVQS